MLSDVIIESSVKFTNANSESESAFDLKKSHSSMLIRSGDVMFIFN